VFPKRMKLKEHVLGAGWQKENPCFWDWWEAKSLCIAFSGEILYSSSVFSIALKNLCNENKEEYTSEMCQKTCRISIPCGFFQILSV
jgi:hypothetical protein